MHEISERHPLQINGGVDSASVRLLVNRPPVKRRSWMIGVALLVIPVGLWVSFWVAALLVVCWPFLTRLPDVTPIGNQVLNFEIDRHGVRFRGVRVSCKLDYMHITLGQKQYKVAGGLTKGEFGRLSALLFRQVPGDRSDVPAEIKKILQ